MRIIDKQTKPEFFNVALVISRYHQAITTKLYEGAIARLQELGFENERITIVWVPGAVEIPLTAQRLAKTNSFKAIICLGAVVFGETRHFDYVCEQVSQGCQRVSLHYDIPVIFGVLTTNTLEQAHDRTGGSKGHMGKQAVDAAFELVSVLHQI